MVLIFCKIHRRGEKAVLAACDKELCGKTLQHGKIEVSVSERFYKEKETSEEELRKMLHEFDNINLIGNKAVAIALEEKLLSQDSVVQIQGVKHAQIFKI